MQPKILNQDFQEQINNGFGIKRGQLNSEDAFKFTDQTWNTKSVGFEDSLNNSIHSNSQFYN